MKQAPLQDIRILQGILFILTLFSIKGIVTCMQKQDAASLYFGRAMHCELKAKKRKQGRRHLRLAILRSKIQISY